MKTNRDLHKTLERLNNQSYKAYKSLSGEFNFKDFTLIFDHIQGDPFASPSRVRVQTSNDFPEYYFINQSRRIAFCDFITRKFHQAIRITTKGNKGSGKSGRFNIDVPKQAVIERSSVNILKNKIEVRFTVGLPAFGRRIAGFNAIEMFLDELPEIINKSLKPENINHPELIKQLETIEDADILREKIIENNYCCFINNGAILPRKSGIDSSPLTSGIPFQSPKEMEVSFELKNRTVTGMAIAKGISLITGGGFHGKSTLLRAIELGIYNHIPGDGREFVVSNPNAVKIRAEDGRYIDNVNISPFISGLPGNKKTTAFSTENASGSTSQAANTIEAIEAGAEVLLIDEDTSATNFMIQDQVMKKLIPESKEPITPFIDRAKELYEQYGVSSIIVIGGSGSYLALAHKVICMVDYEPFDFTEKAKKISASFGLKINSPVNKSSLNISRRLLPASLNAKKGHKIKLQARGTGSLQFGESVINIAAIEQLTEESQLRYILQVMLKLSTQENNLGLIDVLKKIDAYSIEKGIENFSPQKNGDLVKCRLFEIAAAINRLRVNKICISE